MNLDESSEETGTVSWAGDKLVTVDPTGISATTVGIAVGVWAATVGETRSARGAIAEVGVLSPPQAVSIKTETVAMIPIVHFRFSFIKAIQSIN